MATITSENAKQIRDPMKVHIRFEAGGASSITGFAPTPNKSYDETLADTAMPMRKIADLQDGGFILDGSHEWYEDKAPSGNNGKLGLRSIAGQPVSITFIAASRIDSVTVESTGVDYIEKSGTQYQSTGLDVIPIGATSATLTFYPDDPDGRAFIKYIIPGAIFNITNNNLISCNVQLRSNLAADNMSWEESDIDVQFYYPNDISEVLTYIQDDWPLTYEAGYSDEMSEVRKFYLSEPGRQEGNIVTLHGVDASTLMNERTIAEFDCGAITKLSALWNKIKGMLTSAGLRLSRSYITGDNLTKSKQDVPIVPESSLRDLIAMFMNLTAILPESYRFSFVDAGIPTLQVGERFTNVWQLDEEDLAEIVFETPRHINRVVNTSDEHRFDQTVKSTGRVITTAVELAEGQIIEVDFDTFATNVSLGENFWFETKILTPISLTPSRGVWKVTRNRAEWYLKYTPLAFSGGANQYSDGSGLPGVAIEMEPPVLGSLKFNGTNISSPRNLLNRPNQTIQFRFKGDPRMQPRDFLQINRLDGSTYRTRISGIEITHEAGGTSAVVTAMKTNLWKG